MTKVRPPFYVERIFVGKEFEHFLICPQKGEAEHRGGIPLASRFSRSIPLNLPIVSANMDTVTGPEMCIAVAQEGGIGILPRSDKISIEQEANWVREVKRAKSLVVEHPFTILETQTVGEARAEMAKRKVHTLLVENQKGELAGMLTARRIDICQNDNALVEDWMKKRMGRGLAFSRKEVTSLQMAIDEMRGYEGETKLVLIDKHYRIKGLITSKDIGELIRKPLANKDAKGRLRVGAAIGAVGDYLERAAALIEAGADVIVIDIAHAHSVVMEKAIFNFKKKFSHELVGGNVATFEGARFLIEQGVDGIKVGLGSGSRCLTRRKTGVGVPQMHAIRAVWHAVQSEQSDIPIISDGGVREEGDINKALAVGASSVMLGNFLAGTDEAPGEFIPNPVTRERKKSYRGMTSPQAKIESVGSMKEVRNVEGREEEVSYKGSVKDIAKDTRDAIQSMVSYAGEDSLQKAMEKIRQSPCDYLIPLSQASQEESFRR